jgi:hypothetical protein
LVDGSAATNAEDTYASCLRNQVLPQLGELRLSECDTAHLDAPAYQPNIVRLAGCSVSILDPDGHVSRDPDGFTVLDWHSVVSSATQ